MFYNDDYIDEDCAHDLKKVNSISRSIDSAMVLANGIFNGYDSCVFCGGQDNFHLAKCETIKAQSSLGEIFFEEKAKELVDHCSEEFFLSYEDGYDDLKKIAHHIFDYSCKLKDSTSILLQLYALNEYKKDIIVKYNYSHKKDLLNFNFIIDKNISIVLDILFKNESIDKNDINSLISFVSSLSQLIHYIQNTEIVFIENSLINSKSFNKLIDKKQILTFISEPDNQILLKQFYI